MRWRALGSVAPLLLLIGCSPAELPQVQLEGGARHLREFEGSWVGTFENRQSRRSGSIEFRLSADADSAFGEVLMYAEDPNVPLWHRPTSVATLPAEAPQWLDIRFVRLERGYMSGEMEPFYDSHCNCTVITRFLGKKEGERIEGGYTVRGLGANYELTGTWQIQRVPPR